MLSNNKGQVVILDLAIALIIFMSAMVFIVLTYQNGITKLDRETRYNSWVLESYGITDLLIKSEGYPQDWNASDVVVIGLASADRVLSTDKITRFTLLEYNKTKQLLGISGNEFFLQIRDVNNINLFEAGASPLEENPCNKTYESITTQRFAMWEEQRVLVYFTLWNDDCTRNASVGRLIVGGQEQYSSVPADTFEEDDSPAWTNEIQAQDDLSYATAIDESLVMPDYIHFDFPNMGILANREIINVSMKVLHREYLSGGTFSPSDPDRHEIECWNGNWVSLDTYEPYISNSTFFEEEIDLSSCITTVALANNINVRMTFDPAFDAGGTQDIDYAEVTVNAE